MRAPIAFVPNIPQPFLFLIIFAGISRGLALSSRQATAVEDAADVGIGRAVLDSNSAHHTPMLLL